jgi:hypothetical protein
MQNYDLAIPILPSRSIADTVAFYQRLGFEGGANKFDSSYAILRSGSSRIDGFDEALNDVLQ